MSPVVEGLKIPRLASLRILMPAGGLRQQVLMSTIGAMLRVLLLLCRSCFNCSCFNCSRFPSQRHLPDLPTIKSPELLDSSLVAVSLPPYRRQ